MAVRLTASFPASVRSTDERGRYLSPEPMLQNPNWVKAEGRRRILHADLRVRPQQPAQVHRSQRLVFAGSGVRITDNLVRYMQGVQQASYDRRD